MNCNFGINYDDLEFLDAFLGNDVATYIVYRISATCENGFRYLNRIDAKQIIYHISDYLTRLNITFYELSFTQKKRMVDDILSALPFASEVKFR